MKCTTAFNQAFLLFVLKVFWSIPDALKRTIEFRMLSPCSFWAKIHMSNATLTRWSCSYPPVLMAYFFDLACACSLGRSFVHFKRRQKGASSSAVAPLRERPCNCWRQVHSSRSKSFWTTACHCRTLPKAPPGTPKPGYRTGCTHVTTLYGTWVQTVSAPGRKMAPPYVACGMYDCEKLTSFFHLLPPLKARAPPWYFPTKMQSCIGQVLLPFIEFPHEVKLPWSCWVALAAWCWQLGSIGSCMGGASYGAICLLLLAYAPFELIIPPSTLTSLCLCPPMHPLDGNTTPPWQRCPPCQQCPLTTALPHKGDPPPDKDATPQQQRLPLPDENAPWQRRSLTKMLPLNNAAPQGRIVGGGMRRQVGWCRW